METALAYFPIGKPRTAPGAVIVVEGREVAQAFKDPLFGEFRVYRTWAGRRGWWETEPTKVQRLIDAFKGGHNIKNSCFYAGITARQWEHFNDVYPDFCGVREACESNPTFGAMNTVLEGLRTKPDLAFKYVERRNDFNFDSRKADLEKPLQPTVVVPVQINNNVSHEKIKGDARRVADQFVSERSGDGAEGGPHRVENALQV